MMQPLAERVRPRSLTDIVGQEHLLGEGKPLRGVMDNGRLHSMILWGPPGTGKTTLARLVADRVDADFYEISAVSAGVKDIRKVIEASRVDLGFLSKPTILFIDEIHRFNKAQQDALLNSVETGEVTLIGATTENPSFEVISALLSRCQVYPIEPLGIRELNEILEQALKKDEWLATQNVVLEEREPLFLYSGGDARMMLNRFETAVILAKGEPVTAQLLQEVFQGRGLRYDKQGEEHYNLASAFIKSIRGSDPDAAIYWLARMLEAGEDPKFIARRLIIVASEDIGNAEPYALMLATSSFDAVHRIGMPESRIILAQVTTYLASSPKSNAAYLAIDKALDDVRKHLGLPVPIHLRNAPTKLMKDMGYGRNYQYSHEYEEHFSEQQYLPDRLKERIYYEPTAMGREKALKERLEKLWKKRR